MDTFAGLNPWLVVCFAAFAGFLLGRRSVHNSSDWLRYRESERQGELTRFAALAPGDQAEIRSLMAAGRKIDAIKHYRELTGKRPEGVEGTGRNAGCAVAGRARRPEIVAKKCRS